MESTDEQIELKNCPCCGGKAELGVYGLGSPTNESWDVRCTKCGLNTRGYEYKEFVIEAWNKRTELSDLPKWYIDYIHSKLPGILEKLDTDISNLVFLKKHEIKSESTPYKPDICSMRVKELYICKDVMHGMGSESIL